MAKRRGGVLFGLPKEMATGHGDPQNDRFLCGCASKMSKIIPWQALARELSRKPPPSAYLVITPSSANERVNARQGSSCGHPLNSDNECDANGSCFAAHFETNPCETQSTCMVSFLDTKLLHWLSKEVDDHPYQPVKARI